MNWNQGMRGRWILGLAVLLAGCSGGTGEEEAAKTPADTPPVMENQAAAGAAEEAAGFTGSDTLWNAPASLGEPVASFGESPSWTETTVKAANRGTTGRSKTVIGEVVDVSCYLQLGKRGEAHIPCGSNCVANGAPIGVVDDKNDLYLVMAEEHDPRRYGNVALKEAMIPFMAKTVQVTGMLTQRDGVNTLYVLGYTIGDNPNQPSGQ